MTTIAIVKLVLILVGIAGAGGGIVYLKHRLKKGDKAISESKTLKKHKKKSAEVEAKKNKIREDHNETANNIINNPNDIHVVVPDGVSRKHNHAFREPCGKDCPAYDK